jgi:hypothetical protein
MARGRTFASRGSDIVCGTKEPAIECHRRAFPYLEPGSSMQYFSRRKSLVGSGGARNSRLQYSRRCLKPQRLSWTLVQE